MRNKNNNDVLRIFDHFQKTIVQKPSHKQMFTEVRMMKFKVRPMHGDVLSFDLHDEKLIELLWSLGKLDELYQKEYKKLSEKEKNVFYKIFDSMYQKFQTELSKLNLRSDKITNISPTAEIEIYRERQAKKRLN